MKITITGSLGNISKPLVEVLVKKKHEVTLISSNPQKVKKIEEIGATPAIGTIEDVDFLSKSFARADAVYCMIPPGNYFDPNFNQLKFYKQVGENYAQAIQDANVKRVVHLSSVGGDMDGGNGQIKAHHEVEKIMQSLREEVKITTLRPTAFYYNLFGFIPTIKSQGVMVANYGEEDLCPWVSPLDIAKVIEEELENSSDERKVRYIASEELTCNEIAKILGNAIGIPDLKWLKISDEEMLRGYLSVGLNPSLSKGLVEMNRSISNGKLLEDYMKNKPILGKVKMQDFSHEFSIAYKQ